MFSNLTGYIAHTPEVREQLHQVATIVDLPRGGRYSIDDVLAALQGTSGPRLFYYEPEDRGRWLPFLRAIHNSDLAIVLDADKPDSALAPQEQGLPSFFSNRFAEITSQTAKQRPEANTATETVVAETGEEDDLTD